MTFENPQLLYNYDALEPFIDKETMEVHHKIHHKNYTNNLNTISKAVPGELDIHQLLENLDTNDGINSSDKLILEKHGGGHFNHCMFFHLMAKGKSTPSKLLQDRISADFGCMDTFTDEFTKEAMGVFGSGWCWLVYDLESTSKKLKIMTTCNQQCPIMSNKNHLPLLCLDLWEHAYYLKFQANRKSFIQTWWNVVNWELVSELHDKRAINGKSIVITKAGYLVIE